MFTQQEIKEIADALGHIFHDMRAEQNRRATDTTTAMIAARLYCQRFATIDESVDAARGIVSKVFGGSVTVRDDDSNYAVLRDAVVEHLGQFIREDDVAEVALLIGAVEIAGSIVQSAAPRIVEDAADSHDAGFVANDGAAANGQGDNIRHEHSAPVVTDPNDRDNVAVSPMVATSPIVPGAPRHTINATEPATVDNKVGAP